MEIKHAKALLVIGLTDCNALEVIKSPYLTGTAPVCSNSGSIAGLTHQWNVKTKYYTATIPIWVDEVTDVGQWMADFSKPEAKEVVEAIGAWLVCFSVADADRDEHEIELLLDAVQEVVGTQQGYSSDSIMLAVASNKLPGVALSTESRAFWEDEATNRGFELIDLAGNWSNEYGEREGVARIEEALLAHEWSMALVRSDPEQEEDDIPDTSDHLEFSDLLAGDGTSSGMKTALISDQDGVADKSVLEEPGEGTSEQASDVDNLDAMLGKLLAARERVADLPEAQRKKAAADAVRKLMDDNF